MKRYGLYLGKQFKSPLEEIETLKSGLSELGYSEVECSKADLIFVVGGDGSLLHALSDNNYRGNYVLINAGTLGYYADYEIREISKLLEDIKREDFTKEYHRVLVLDDGVNKYLAANDIMIGSAIKTLKIALTVNDVELFVAPSSGILFSTQFGSTGYAHSLGGSLMLEDNGYAMNLLAPVHNRVYHSYISSLILRDTDCSKVTITNDEIAEVATDMRTCPTTSKEFKIYRSEENFCLLHFKPCNELQRIKKSFTER